MAHPLSQNQDLVVNADKLPGIAKGDIVEIFQPMFDGQGREMKDRVGSRVLLQVTEVVKTRVHWQLSMSQQIVDLYQIQTRFSVSVTAVRREDAEVRLDFLELIVRDQYVSRSDMWRLKQDMLHSCVYHQKDWEAYGLRAQVGQMITNGRCVSCGLITPDTKVIFRSR